MDEKEVKEAQKAKEIIDAERDIQSIKNILNDPQFHSKANSLYEKLIQKVDYLPYIAVLKSARGMLGNQSFGALSYLHKRQVLKMIKDAIDLYIIKTMEKGEK